MKKRIIECVPNFSEGVDMGIIKQITDAIESAEGVKLLNVDPGKATNRTVVTFVGEPEAVIEGAYRGIKKASELIDMSKHQGEHPRMGATDVCPLIPISGVSMDETVAYSVILAKRVGDELSIPVFLYEHSATDPRWKNLANIRAGEYEKMAEKLAGDDFTPNFGPQALHIKSGVTAIGARDFLIAYNVNLNSTSERRANSVAFDVREAGRPLKKDGKIVKDEFGNPMREEGKCKGVKGIGWFIEEYGVAQVSMNITNIHQSPLHVVFEECVKSADKRGMRVTGSELVGLVPKQVLIDAGKYFLKKQERSVGISEEEIIKIAILSMGLDELTPFDPKKRVIEYMLDEDIATPLLDMNLRAFANETASESMAPGGGSISAYVGALGASLATMVANISSHKKGFDERWFYYSEWAEKGQYLKDRLLTMVDEDTNSFNQIMLAMRLPKGSDAEKAARLDAIQQATKYAVDVPFQVMQLSFDSFELIKAMVIEGNPNSITDAGVAALCARAAVHGAYMNVLINVGGLDDKEFVANKVAKGKELIDKIDLMEKEMLDYVHDKIK